MRPYVDICESLFPDNPTPFQLLQESSTVDWMITSFIRGITLDNAIIVVDECQNMNDMEMNMVKGGMGLKDVDEGKNPGLSKLPTEVRNKMGYMADGGISAK